MQCVAYYNKHWAQLVTIIAHHLRPNEMVRRNIENVQIRRAGEELQQIMHPINEAIDALQQRGVRLSDAVDTWLTLRGDFPRRTYKAAFTQVQARSTMVLASGPFLAGYLVDTRYAGSRLTGDQIVIASRWVCEMIPADLHISDEITGYISGTAPYNLPHPGSGTVPSPNGS